MAEDRISADELIDLTGFNNSIDSTIARIDKLSQALYDISKTAKTATGFVANTEKVKNYSKTIASLSQELLDFSKALKVGMSDLKAETLSPADASTDLTKATKALIKNLRAYVSTLSDVKVLNKDAFEPLTTAVATLTTIGARLGTFSKNISAAYTEQSTTTQKAAATNKTLAASEEEAQFTYAKNVVEHERLTKAQKKTIDEEAKAKLNAAAAAENEKNQSEALAKSLLAERDARVKSEKAAEAKVKADNAATQTTKNNTVDLTKAKEALATAEIKLSDLRKRIAGEDDTELILSLTKEETALKREIVKLKSDIRRANADKAATKTAEPNIKADKEAAKAAEVNAKAIDAKAKADKAAAEAAKDNVEAVAAENEKLKEQSAIVKTVQPVVTTRYGEPIDSTQEQKSKRQHIKGSVIKAVEETKVDTAETNALAEAEEKLAKTSLNLANAETELYNIQAKISATQDTEALSRLGQEESALMRKVELLKEEERVNKASAESIKGIIAWQEQEVNSDNKVVQSSQNSVQARNNVMQAVVKAATAKAEAAAMAEGTTEGLSAEQVAALRLKEAYFALAVAEQDEAQEASAVLKQASLVLAAGKNEKLMVEDSIGAYERLTAAMRYYKQQYLALGEDERTSPEGLSLLEGYTQAAVERKKILTDLNEQAKRQELINKLEQERQYLTTDLAKQEAELKGQITAQNEQLKIITELERERARLNRAEAARGIELSNLSTGATRVIPSNAEYATLLQTTKQAQWAEEYAKAQAKLAAANEKAAGSYEALEAEYELNKLRLRELSYVEQANGEIVDKSAQEVALLRQEYERLITRQGELQPRLRAMQNSFAGYTDALHNYSNSWNGLTFSITQVIREIPSATVSMNTFFLAISNNVPMVLDELQRLKKANEAAIASGGKAVSIGKAIAKSIFSLNSLLVLIVTLLTFFGEDILKAVKSLNIFNKSVLSSAKALKNVNKEFKEVSKETGKQVASLYSLSAEWSHLKTTAEKTQWIKDNKTEFDKLGVSINNINDAEKLFVEHTEEMVRALISRGMAEAASNLAAKDFEDAAQKKIKAIEKERKAEEAWQAYQAQRAKDLEAGEQEISTTVMASTATTRTGEVYTSTKVVTKAEELGNAWQSAAKAASKANDEFDQAIENGKVYTELSSQYTQQFTDMLKEMGLEPDHKGAQGRESDLTTYLENMALKVKKTLDDLIEASEPDELKKREDKIVHDYEETLQDLEKTLRINQNKLNKNHKALTAQQITLLKEANANILRAIEENEKKKQYLESQLALDRQIRTLSTLNKQAELEISGERDNAKAIYEERLGILKRNMKIEIAENRKLAEAEQVSELDIRHKYVQEIAKLQEEYRQKVLAIKQATNDLIIASTEVFDFDNLQAQLAKVNAEYTAEINANRLLAEEAQQDVNLIIKKYMKQRAKIYADYFTTLQEQQQAADKAEFDAAMHSSYEITKFELQQERDKWKLKLEMQQKGLLEMSDDQIREAKANIRRLNQEISTVGLSAFSEGLGSGILQLLGFDDKAIDAFDQTKQYIIDGVNEILQAELDAAQRAIDAQKAKVDAAQTAYDAEVQARANGYANNVAMAKRELAIQKQTLAKKQAQAEKYQKAQLNLDTMQQASSLATAIANTYQAFSKIPYGYIIATVLNAAMLGSFVAQRAIAYNTVGAEYGEGGLEFLEGGSHASGHDINLGTKNSKGKQMHAEGGEALAIINKRKTRKYRSILPGIIDSLNAGTFEDKYMHAYDGLNTTTVVTASNVNLKALEHGVNKLVSQNNTRTIALSDRIIVIDGNVKRTIKL